MIYNKPARRSLQLRLNIWYPGVDTIYTREGVSISIAALELTVTSDSLGTYGIVDNIPPATYTLEFSLDGYTTNTQEVEVRSADETITLNVLMAAE